MRKQIPRIAVYIVLLLIVFTVYRPMMDLDTNYVISERGIADASIYDLSKVRARIFAANWEYYPKQLYTPEDFQNGSAGAPIYENNVNSAEYGTYRITLILPPGKTYGMTGRSFLYSTKIYVNGRPAAEIGQPGETPETTKPHTNTYALYFTPQSKTTEIIFQTANFQMKDGGGSYSFSLGEAALTEQYRLTRMTGAMVTVGSLITVSLIFTGMFIFFSKRQQFLWYAVLVFMIAVRDLFIRDKPIMEFFPDIDWYLSIRIEYFCTVLIFVFTLIYFYTLYPKFIWKPAFFAAQSLSVLYSALIAFTEPMFFGNLLSYFFILWAAAGVYILVKLALGFKNGGSGRILIFTGLMFFLLTAVNDMIQYALPVYMPFYDMLSTGMLMFVYMNMTALFLGFAETEAALYETNRKAEILAAKTAIYGQINHDIRTPLTVISNYAQMVMEQLAENEVNEQTITDLNTIRSEAEHLAKTVSVALHNSENGNNPEELDMIKIIKRIYNVFAGQMKSARRGFAADIPEKAPAVWGSADDIIRILWNLLDNAIKHNEHGDIVMSVSSDGANIIVEIADKGEGIEPEIYSKLFTRGISGKGGTGLGLFICREIAGKYNGEITVHSEYGSGTTATLTLPVYNAEGKNKDE